MVKVQKFEDLLAWQKARVMVSEVYKLTGERLFARDFALKDQVRRSAIAVMSQIAEGFERGNSAEFHRSLQGAAATCAELRSQIYIASDAGYVTWEQSRDFLKLSDELSRVIGGLRSALLKSQNRSIA